jgi:hypothetical protein
MQEKSQNSRGQKTTKFYTEDVKLLGATYKIQSPGKPSAQNNINVDDYLQKN